MSGLEAINTEKNLIALKHLSNDPEQNSRGKEGKSTHLVDFSL